MRQHTLRSLAFAGFCMLLSISSACAAPPGTQPASGRMDITLDDALGEASTNPNVIFVFDNSGSMDESNCAGSFDTKFTGAKWAVGEAVKGIPHGTNLGLVSFDPEDRGYAVKVRQSLTEDGHTSLITAMNQLSPNTNTPLAEAIVEGVNEIVKQYKKQLGYGTYRIVVITDGAANGLKHTISQAVSYADGFGIPIYTIGFCLGNDHALKRGSVRYGNASSPEEVKGLLTEFTAEQSAPDISAGD
jgi:hypothetical protein